MGGKLSSSDRSSRKETRLIHRSSPLRYIRRASDLLSLPDVGLGMDRGEASTIVQTGASCLLRISTKILDAIACASGVAIDPLAVSAIKTMFSPRAWNITAQPGRRSGENENAVDSSDEQESMGDDSSVAGAKEGIAGSMDFGLECLR
ncbi:uncharacterized protein LOC112341087 [Selaginella moellendorffii]|uniref:uncharacterized protein LOC112341087 n=1 Tax=Selaginella moellendorffii TaxID=88036 RepID=UPI000D1C96C6|nr:uncharacterized protein LOC112341087 [Selaginella moellendorffii]|eukprot:XP_024516352.1 uncharacterized protein LOC112341087 [Selaginella moellendorffii]